MKVPLLDIKRQYSFLKKQLLEQIEHVFDSSSFILGSQVKTIEETVANYCNVKNGIGVANGTDALELTLRALEIGVGDEVITTPFTFFATAEVISKLGATPVFADINPETYLLDPTEIENKISSKTKAIIPVHLFGQVCNMDSIEKIASNRGIHIVEDSCQAIGATYRNKKASSMGIGGCFSFFPSKNLGCAGDGGMIVTNDDELASRIKLLRAHGSNKKYYHEIIGYNSRLDEIQAAILNVKFKYLDEWNMKRRNLAQRYNDMLKDYVKIPSESNEYEHFSIYHQYTIETENRNKLESFLSEKGIGTSVYYPVPLHLQKVYENLGHKEGDLINSENASNRVLSLPIFPEMTEIEQDYIISNIIEWKRMNS